METDELLESINLNTRHIEMNLHLINHPSDVVELANEYLNECGTAIVQDIHQCNDIEETSAALAYLHAKTIWLQQVVEFYMSELERVIELELEEKLRPFPHLSTEDCLPDFDRSC